MRAHIVDDIAIARTIAATRDPQDVSMILLSARLGLRAVELSRLDWKMLRTATGEIAEVLDLPPLASKGRSGAAVLPLDAELRRALLRLSASRRHPRRGPVFTFAPLKRLSADAIRQRIKRLYQAANVDATSHSGRRRIAVAAVNDGRSIAEVQRFLRHAHAETTLRYVKQATDYSMADLLTLRLT